MIILEGPDGSGKSTLAKKIQEQFNFKVGERGVADRDKLYEVTRKDTHRALAYAVEANGKPLIWDRLFYSDFVYAPVQGRDIAFTPHEQYWVQAMIDLLCCPIIVCLPSLVEVEKNITKEKQMVGVSENIGKIWRAYSTLFLENGLFHKPNIFPAMWYDYTGEFQAKKAEGQPITDSVEAICAGIGEYQELRKEREAWA